MQRTENYMSVLDSGTTCVHGDGNRVNESDEGIFSDGKPSSPESEPARDLDSRKEGPNKRTTIARLDLVTSHILILVMGLNLQSVFVGDIDLRSEYKYGRFGWIKRVG